ncbi:MAG: hypothetical protein MI802_17025 [Desulfobacterales bacterium]|nr:hypothetical protein [Desulfobacterales bacterium]
MIRYRKIESYKSVLVTIALITAVGISLASCGKKAPPQPPLNESVSVARPVNLTHTQTDALVTISWEVVTGANASGTAPEGFEISMATKDAAGCEGCPFIFKTVGTVAMPAQQFQYRVKKGLHHYFRIQSMGPDGIKSKYSDTLYMEAE